jgi:aryl-alcohol dehydrogenase-like predicted oxidoreductase
MKLALGTVQFGLPYGVANQTGQVSREAARHILAYALESDIDTLDTAIAYGESEAYLGEIGAKKFKIVTKLPTIPEGVANIDRWVNGQVQASLRRLGVDNVYGLLLHRSHQLTESRGKALAEALLRLKAEGVVGKIGVSVYSPTELEKTIQSCPVDLVQAPFNLLDRRLHTSGWLTRLHDAGIEIHTRSAFLQGLLLLPRKRIPPKFKPWDALWSRWHEWLEDNSTSAPEACLQFALSFAEIDRVVIGVDSKTQLEELVMTALATRSKILPDLACEDDRLINPTNWNQLETI